MKKLTPFSNFYKCDRLPNLNTNDETIRESGIYEGRGWLQKSSAPKELEHGLDNHNKALWQACTRGDMHCVRWALVEKKLLIWKRSDLGLRKLGGMTGSGTWQVVQCDAPIEDPDRSVNARHYNSNFQWAEGCSAAHQAAQNKFHPQLDIMNLLAEHGWDLELKNDYGMTPKAIYHEVEWHKVDAHQKTSKRQFANNSLLGSPVGARINLPGFTQNVDKKTGRRSGFLRNENQGCTSSDVPGMAKVSDEIGAQGVLLLGDNVYSRGVETNTSKRFQETFEEFYPVEAFKSLPFFVIAGNHDHAGNVQAQINYHGSPRWHFPELYYTLPFQFTSSSGVARTA